MNCKSARKRREKGRSSLTLFQPIKSLLSACPDDIPNFPLLLSLVFLISHRSALPAPPSPSHRLPHSDTLPLAMAANSLQALRHPLVNYSHLHYSDAPPLCVFLKPITAASPSVSLKFTSHFTAFASSLTSSSSSSVAASPSISFDLLEQYLSCRDFRQADEETRRLLIVLAGEPAVKRGYVFFSEVQFISDSDLQTIDRLWKESSDNRFGYSVQKRIWQKAGRDFTNFFIRVGWMKKLDSEVEQYNYRAFPDEFLWELKDDTPLGHLPLTNALRGTQLLNSILTHPAFESSDEEAELLTVEEKAGSEGDKQGTTQSTKPSLSKIFKPDYSF